MIDVKLICSNPELVVNKLKKRHFNAQPIVNEIITAYEVKRKAQAEADQQKAELNKLSKEIGTLLQNNQTANAQPLQAQTTNLKEAIKQADQNLDALEAQIFKLITQLPNLPYDLVPEGKTAEDNLVVRSGGEMPDLKNNALSHWDLIKKYDIIDFELGTKLTGAGFPVYKGKGAKLQRAIINFALDAGIAAGYTEYMPPIMVNEASAFATGQLPDKEGQMYHIGDQNFYLIPTAEVPLTNLFRDVTLNAQQLPIKCIGYTPCFRREAGSWGSHVRGLNRLHQFDKVEIVQITEPQNSMQALEGMVAHVEGLVKQLELPYRILRLCGGDLPFGNAITYDFEMFSAAQQRWLEISSVSCVDTYQSIRLKCRYKNTETQQLTHVHTLNGSALALPRIVATLLENNQTEHGIRIPKALVPYCGFEFID